MSEHIEWLNKHSDWTRIGTLAAMFFAAMALGYGLGAVVGPGSNAIMVLGFFGFFMTLAVGYSLWRAYTMSVLTSGLFGGLLTALFRFLFSRERKDLESAKESLVGAFTDPERAAHLAGKIRGRAAIFTWLGPIFGMLTGIVVSVSGSTFGVLDTVAIYAGAGLAYGFLLNRLGWAGYLMFPASD